jgi:uncharacterized membrane protein
MIGQNRQAAYQQAKADHDFTEQELELQTNTQLTREIHTLTTELHNRVPTSRHPAAILTARGERDFEHPSAAHLGSRAPGPAQHAVHDPADAGVAPRG